MVQVIQAMMCRQRTFLGQDIWKTVPWEDDPSKKESIDFLVDLISDVPELLEMARFKTDQPDQPIGWAQAQTAQMLIRTSTLLEKLDEWKISWERTNPYSYFEASTSKSSNADRHKYTSFLATDKSDVDISSSQPASTTSLLADSPFPTLLQFSGLWRAYELCLYNATRIIVLEVYISLIRLQGQAETSHSKHSNLQLDPIALDSQVRALAIDICRSMYYLCIEAQGSLHTVLIIFPARLAYNSLDRGSRESIWLGRILETFAATRGFAMGGVVMQDLFHNPKNMQTRRLEQTRVSTRRMSYCQQ